MCQLVNMFGQAFDAGERDTCGGKRADDGRLGVAESVAYPAGIVFHTIEVPRVLQDLLAEIVGENDAVKQFEVDSSVFFTHIHAETIAQRTNRVTLKERNLPTRERSILVVFTIHRYVLLSLHHCSFSLAFFLYLDRHDSNFDDKITTSYCHNSSVTQKKCTEMHFFFFLSCARVFSPASFHITNTSSRVLSLH